MKVNKKIFSKITLISTSFLFVFALLFAVVDKRDSFNVHYASEGHDCDEDLFSGVYSPVDGNYLNENYLMYDNVNDFSDVLKEKKVDTACLKPKEGYPNFCSYYHFSGENSDGFINKETPYVYESFRDEIPDYRESGFSDPLSHNDQIRFKNAEYNIRAYFYSGLNYKNKKEFYIECFPGGPHFYDPEKIQHFKIFCYLKDSIGRKTLFGMVYILGTMGGNDVEYLKKYLSEQIIIY